ncbi:MAG: TolC family protein [Bacteroidales bacterium]|nr:TolC family protein [Bacteroidales bacterium]
MKTTTTTLLLATAFISVSAQDIDSIYSSIEANNAMLNALRQQTAAEKYEAHTGNTISDPNVGVNYLWGNPSDLESNRFDLNVSQSFDFPSVYQYRRKVADGIANIADLKYLVSRRELLAEVAQVFVDIAYCTELNTILSERCKMASIVMNSIQKSFNTGESTIIELNRAKTAYMSAMKDLKLNEIERDKAIVNLMQLNGGIAIDMPSATLEIRNFIGDFEQWYATACSNCPEILIELQNIEQASNNLKLQKAQNLPKFTLGYMSERTDETTLQGVSFEVSIPLFERKNTLRSAKAQKAAAEAQMNASAIQHKNDLRALHAQATTLSNLANSMEQMISECSTANQLVKSLESGQINILEFHDNIHELYDMKIEVLGTKKDAMITIERLKVYEK